jgi:hypothetical protein
MGSPKTRGLFPPRSQSDEEKENQRSTSFVELGLMLTILVSLATSAGSIFFGGPLGPGGFIIDFVVFFIGQLVLVVGIALSNDAPPWRKKLIALPLAPIGEDGSVAVLEGTVMAGPDGPFDAPLSKTPCVWSVVRVELTTGSGRTRTTRRERLEKTSLFRIETPDGTTAFVDPNDGEMLFGFGAADIPTPAMRELAVAENLKPRDDETVYASERRVVPGEKVFVVGIVRRTAGGQAYRGEEAVPTIASDATTGLTISCGDRERAITASAPLGGRSLVMWGAGSIAFAALGSLLLRVLTHAE